MNTHLQHVSVIAGALSDENRLKALAALASGELCLCQLVTHLQLAPSTVSKHMDLLFKAGLVSRRKQGRWHYFQLASGSESPAVHQALNWCLPHLENHNQHLPTRQKLKQLRKMPLEQACACYQ